MNNSIKKEILFLSAQIIGGLILFTVLLRSHLKIEFKWVMSFVGIFFFANLIWTLLLWIVSRLTKTNYANQFFLKPTFKTRIPWFLCTLAEDGLFFGSLLCVGINYVSVSAYSLIFALYHLLEYPPLTILPRGIGFFFVASYILPQSGISSIIIGHWIFDLLVLVLIPEVFRFGIPYKLYFDNGKIKEEGFYVNNKREGLIRHHYPNGNKEYEYFSVKDKPNGDAKWFDENGSLTKEGVYKDGQLEGKFKWYDKTGNVIKEGNYKNNSLEGTSRVYYPSGKLKYIQNYVQGKTNGHYQIFYENGIVKEEGEYKDGLPHGLCRWFNADGSLRTEANYEDGKVVGEVKKLESDGK